MTKKEGMPDWYQNLPKFENNKRIPIKITEKVTTYGIDGNDILSKVFVSTENLNTSDYICPAGGFLVPPGMHCNEEIYYIVSGEAIIQNPDNGEAVKVKEGNAVVIPRGTLHQVFNFGEKPLDVLCFMNEEWGDKEWDQLEKMVKENK